MKANLAFGILLLACSSLSGMASSPVSEINLRTISMGKCVNSIESESHQQQNANLRIFESSVEEDKSVSKFKEKPFRSHSQQEQSKLQPAELSTPVDFNFLNAESPNCILSDTRYTAYIEFHHPQPAYILIAFIRNCILQV